MNKIDENPVMVGFRGQLYSGERKHITSDAYFSYGDGEYFSTHYGDASTYAKANTDDNLDLSGNVSKLSKSQGISYSDALAQLTRDGDGMVLTAQLAPRKMMLFGGEQFANIDNLEEFTLQFDKALRLVGASDELRENSLDFIIKNNDNPRAIADKLVKDHVSGALNQYAKLCGCDAFKLRANVAPSGPIHHWNDVEHIIVLDKTRLEVLRQDAPIVMDREFYKLSLSCEDRSEIRDAYDSACNDKVSEILSGIRFSSSLSVAAIKVNDTAHVDLITSDMPVRKMRAPKCG